MALAIVYRDGTWAKRRRKSEIRHIQAVFLVSIGMNHLELRCLSGHIAKVVQFHSGATALGGMSFSAAFRLLYGNELAGGASERV